MKKADNAKKKRPSYRDFYEFARLMKMAGKNICADGINKEIYIHNIIGSLVPDGKGWGLPHMAMRDDSGYRSIFIEGKDGSDDESYALLYADNEDENTGYRYRCYPPLRDMVSILKNIYNGKKDDSVEYHIVRKGTLYMSWKGDVTEFVSRLSEYMREIMDAFISLNMTAEEIMEKNLLFPMCVGVTQEQSVILQKPRRNVRRSATALPCGTLNSSTDGMCGQPARQERRL